MIKHEKFPFPDVANLGAEEAAEQWLVYHQSGLISEQGRQAFSNWLSEAPENQQAYIGANQLWQDLGFVLLHDVPNETSGIRNTESETQRERLHVKKWLWGLAATVLIGFGAMDLTAQLSPEITTASYVSQIGEIKSLLLEDNSTVTLSADSRLETYFSDKKRQLKLLRGRAFFEVAPDKSRPFVVSAGNSSVTAVGTAFDVNNTVNGVNVAVTHGIVDVQGFRDREHTQHRNKAKLFAGQVIHAQENGELGAVQRENNPDALSWRNGRLVFEGETLSVITQEVNRYRHQKIRLTDDELQRRRITLSVPVDKTDLLIGAIKTSELVDISETDSEIVISLVR